MVRGFAVFIFLVFIGKLFMMQVVQGKEMAAQVMRDDTVSRTIAAPRGEIQDVNGLPLAVSSDAYNITADQTLIRNPQATAQLLAPVIGADPTALAQHLTGKHRFVYVAKEVSPADLKRVEDLNLAGIFSEPSTRRVYPQGELAANVIGFVNGEGVGAGGIEGAYNSELSGTPGRVQYMQAGGQVQIPTGDQVRTDPIPGTSIRLTLDRDVQWIAQRAITDRVQYAKAASGTVIAIDVTNGHILAMATAPTFNPNDIRPQDIVNLGNRAVGDAYEPGSTAKVMTMSGLIEAGKATPLDHITVPPSLPWKHVATFHDAEPHGTLKLTLTGVLALSSNIGTIKAASRLTDQQLYDNLVRFGMGQSTHSGLPGESGGVLPPLNTWSLTTFPTLAFGQGFSLTALQVAEVFATVANDGVRIQPSIIAGTVDPNGHYTPAPPAQTTRVVSASTAQQVRAMMETVVSNDGTAPNAAIPGYRVAGKTGTAQRVDPSCHCYRGYVASFIGIAPAEHPRFVVAVALTNPKNGHFGSTLGGPVFKEVMTYLLQKWRIPPSASKAPALPTTWK